jgi:hypothetical protein
MLVAQPVRCIVLIVLWYSNGVPVLNPISLKIQLYCQGIIIWLVYFGLAKRKWDAILLQCLIVDNRRILYWRTAFVYPVRPVPSLIISSAGKKLRHPSAALVRYCWETVFCFERVKERLKVFERIPEGRLYKSSRHELSGQWKRLWKVPSIFDNVTDWFYILV